MGAPYTATSVANYNSNPPSDDGSTTATNRVSWSTQKTKLTDPLKTAFDTSETNTAAALLKVLGGGAVLGTSVDYTVLAADQGKMIKVTASGKTITTPDATSVGSPFWFMVKNASTGAITLAGNNPGVQQNVDGSASVSIGSGAGCIVGTDGTNWFTDGVPTTALPVPQGYLTSSPGTPIITSDGISNNVIFYTPFMGSWTVVHNGSSLIPLQFTEQSLVLTSSQAANNIYDIFFAFNGGGPVIGTGPSWSAGTGGSVTAGSCARGTGAGGTSLTRLSGVWVNNVQISLIWNTGSGNTTITVPANQGVYLGSIFIDSVAGQVTCHRSYGQSRKWGIWNAYNRQPVYLKAGDSTATWGVTTASWQAANANSANSFTTFQGLQEEILDINYRYRGNISSMPAGQTFDVRAGIGVNSTSSPSTFEIGQAVLASSVFTGAFSILATHNYLPTIGINTYTALEQSNASTTTTASGGEAAMAITGRWRA